MCPQCAGSTKTTTLLELMRPSMNKTERIRPLSSTRRCGVRKNATARSMRNPIAPRRVAALRRLQQRTGIISSFFKHALTTACRTSTACRMMVAEAACSSSCWARARCAALASSLASPAYLHHPATSPRTAHCSALHGIRADVLSLDMRIGHAWAMPACLSIMLPPCRAPQQGISVTATAANSMRLRNTCTGQCGAACAPCTLHKAAFRRSPTGLSWRAPLHLPIHLLVLIPCMCCIAISRPWCGLGVCHRRIGCAVGGCAVTGLPTSAPAVYMQVHFHVVDVPSLDICHSSMPKQRRRAAKSTRPAQHSTADTP